MSSFDTLTDRVQAAAGDIGAFGYLNSAGGEALEVRFQMRPPTSLWDRRLMGVSQRFHNAAALDAYLAALTRAAQDHRAALEAGDPDALDQVLARALESMRV